MDEDFSLDELKLAFTWHIVHQILGSDGVVCEAEQRFVKRTFPDLLLERSGFFTETGFTQRWQDALGEALLTLPTLSVPERVQIVDTLFKAAMADDQFEHAEGEILRRAARLIALQDEQVTQILEGLVTSEVELHTEETEGE